MGIIGARLLLWTVREGRGTERYPNGDVFVGHFEKDVKHGLGSYFFVRKGRRSTDSRWLFVCMGVRLDCVWKEGRAEGGSYRNLRMECGEASEIPVLELRDPRAVLSEIERCNAP